MAAQLTRAALAGLGEEQAEMYEMAKSYADKNMFPHAEHWDAKEEFPKEVLQELASLGFAAIAGWSPGRSPRS